MTTATPFLTAPFLTVLRAISRPEHDSYFVIDDVIGHRGREGYVVLYGNPHTACGTRCGEFLRLREACQYLRAHMDPGEQAYRVRLARRHGTHSVRPLAVA